MELWPHLRKIEEKGLAFLKKHYFWLVVVIFSLFYLFLQSSNVFIVQSTALYDDTLQYGLSQNISEGNWLGPYNGLTLAKGVTYPVFTAFVHTTGVPLWVAQAVLQILACLALVIALRLLLRRNWQASILFVVLLFNFMIIPRPYRDAIAPQLMELILAWLIGSAAVIYKRKKYRWLLLWALVGAVSLPAWWFLREDSFFIVPAIVGVIGVCIGISIAAKKYIGIAGITKSTIIMTVPIVSLLIVYAGIGLLNHHYYGTFVVNDYTSSDFDGAIGQLSRIEAGSRPNTVPVSKAMREEAYQVSPAFRELQPCLDGGGPCEGWTEWGAKDGDYDGGWFPWAVRQAVGLTGHYATPGDARTYYTTLEKQISDACKSGALKCNNAPFSKFVPKVSAQTIVASLGNFSQAIKFLVSLDGYVPHTTPTPIDANTPTMASYFKAGYSGGTVSQTSMHKLDIINFIQKIYQAVNVPLAIISVCSFIATLSLWRYAKKYWLVLTLTAIVGVLAVFRAFTLSYVATYSFPSINSIYLDSAYVLMFVFEVSSIAVLYSVIVDIVKKKKQIDSSKSKRRV